MPRKLGRTSKERIALLRNPASQLLWYGKIETTAEKAKELRSYVEKLITKAINTYVLPPNRTDHTFLIRYSFFS